MMVQKLVIMREELRRIFEPLSAEVKLIKIVLLDIMMIFFCIRILNISSI